MGISTRPGNVLEKNSPEPIDIVLEIYLNDATTQTFSKGDSMTVVYSVLAFCGILLLWGVFTYNRLVRKRNMMKEGWSGIDVQLKRRSDLIPNLVTLVKAYAAHEKESLEEITRLRGLAQMKRDVEETARAESLLSTAMARVLAIVEDYPDLKASDQFIELQHALREVEEHIQYARRYFNGTVRELNIMVESFPSNLVAKLFRFEKGRFFELESIENRVIPMISF